MSYTNWPKAEKVSWSKVDASRSPSPLPRWLYYGEITDVKVGLSKANQSPMVSCTIALQSSYDDLVDVGARKVFSHLVFTQKAAFRPKQLCEALGCDPPETTSEADLNAFAEQVLGESVWMILKQRVYEGAKQNDIEAFLSEGEIEEASEGMEPPVGEVAAKPAKTKSRSANGAKANGPRAAAAEMDTDEDADDEDEDEEEEGDSDEDTDEDSDGDDANKPPARGAQAEAAAEPRRRGRPPKDRSVRR